MNADEQPDPSLVLLRSKPGWYQISHPTNPALHVYVTGTVGEPSGDVTLTNVMVAGQGPVRAADLRAIPLGRIEAVLRRSHFAEWLKQPGGDYVLMDLIQGLDEDKPRLPPLDPSRQKLTRPDGTDPDAFLESVAEAYRDLRPLTKNVALAIAKEADVPPATARRWIYDARRRGFLTEGGRREG